KLGIPVDPAAPPGERAASHIEPRSSPVAPAASSGDPDHLAAIRALGEELLELLESQAIDHTGFFRALTEGEATSLFTDPSPFRAWHQRLLDLRGSGPAADSAVAAMAGANPLYIPRNVRLDAALRSAHLGHLEPVHRLLEAVARRLERRPGLPGLARAPAGSARLRSGGRLRGGGHGRGESPLHPSQCAPRRRAAVRSSRGPGPRASPAGGGGPALRAPPGPRGPRGAGGRRRGF